MVNYMDYFERWELSTDMKDIARKRKLSEGSQPDSRKRLSQASDLPAKAAQVNAKFTPRSSSSIDCDSFRSALGPKSVGRNQEPSREYKKSIRSNSNVRARDSSGANKATVHGYKVVGRAERSNFVEIEQCRVADSKLSAPRASSIVRTALQARSDPEPRICKTAVDCDSVIVKPSVCVDRKAGEDSVVTSAERLKFKRSCSGGSSRAVLAKQNGHQLEILRRNSSDSNVGKYLSDLAVRDFPHLNPPLRETSSKEGSTSESSLQQSRISGTNVSIRAFDSSMNSSTSARSLIRSSPVPDRKSAHIDVSRGSGSHLPLAGLRSPEAKQTSSGRCITENATLTSAPQNPGSRSSQGISRKQHVTRKRKIKPANYQQPSRDLGVALENDLPLRNVVPPQKVVAPETCSCGPVRGLGSGLSLSVPSLALGTINTSLIGQPARLKSDSKVTFHVRADGFRICRTGDAKIVDAKGEDVSPLVRLINERYACKPDSSLRPERNCFIPLCSRFSIYETMDASSVEMIPEAEGDSDEDLEATRVFTRLSKDAYRKSLPVGMVDALPEVIVTRLYPPQNILPGK